MIIISTSENFYYFRQAFSNFCAEPSARSLILASLPLQDANLHKPFEDLDLISG